MVRGAVEYAPSTFEERGAAVAFTTPLLSQTRVRRGDRSKLEVLIPSLSQGMGIYVVPWKAVPEMVSMTMHDRYLHDLIVKEEACSPNEIRRATLRAARRGLAGPKAAQAARRALDEDEEQGTLTHYLLILAILKAVGLESPEMLKAGIDTDEGQRLTRQLMTRAAESLRLDATLLYARLAEVAAVAAPVGLARSPRPGRLVRCLVDLTAFRDAMADWARTVPSDAAPVAGFCAEVAQHTIGIGERVLADFHRRLEAIGPLMRDWDGEIVRVRGQSARMAWLLDGWSHITAAWDVMQAEDQRQQAATINELFRILPLLPTQESSRDLMEESRHVKPAHRRSVRMLEDWRTGQFDIDAIRRIEAVKARAP
ncbi:hypothetical protein [Azospirillum picis]|uniref:Uncharacterized protein n=1 Tax=Azospirillum picis TaxID=488438 RepID=A0ABU0MTA4_9PROT|nr:hypothetical protein [Azospirillum picis]MBP2302953.1 hypothetical protein [Azospirillum picis]MDQ0536705.1 hypothetical protein [Azospirillum picis]